MSNSTAEDGMATITGTALDDSLVGMAGQCDTLYGLAGNDTLTGGGSIEDPVVRVSVAADGAQAAGGASYAPVLSADGRHVVFESNASNLVAGDSNGTYDVFVKDTVTGTVTRVSTSATGAQATGASGAAAVSADGRYVAFVSAATNLVPGDTNGRWDLFVKDTQTGAITQVAMDDYWALAFGAAFHASLSADGRYVAFHSYLSNLVAGDTNGQRDIFVKDMLSGAVTRVSMDAGGAEVNGNSGWPVLSADGRYVVFDSWASNLVPGDTNGVPDVFLKDTLTGAIARVSTDASGAEVYWGGDSPALSADGRYVVFESYDSSLVPGDSNGAVDIFLKDTWTGAISRVNTSASGDQATGYSGNAAVSGDGRYVVFTSGAANLVPGDTNGTGDIFVKDARTGAIARLSTADGGSLLATTVNSITISADGRYVLLSSAASNLVAGDTNGQPDIFRVRNPLIEGDVLRGGPGDDTYLVAVPNDLVVEAPNEGTDTIQSRISYTLPANVENLVLIGNGIVRGTGNALANSLTGNDAANILDGGPGADTMAGGRGSDTYVVDDAGDTVNELPGSGVDRILSSVSLVLPDNVENLILTAPECSGTGNGLANTIFGTRGRDFLDGGAGMDTVSYAKAPAGVNVRIDLAPVVNRTGGAGEDTLSNFENIIGSAFNDTLTGSAGANVIEGGAGNDVMDGGAGSDTVSYATAGIAVRVNLSRTVSQFTGAGWDTLKNFEHLIGSAYNDILVGNAQNNTVEGGAGDDGMDGGGGTDTASYSTAGASVTVNLGLTAPQNTGGAGRDTLVNFESLIGSRFNDTLAGNAGNNVMDGGAGNDVIDGGAGSDIASYASATAGVTVNLRLSTPQATGGAGTDTLLNFEHLLGSRFADTLIGDAGGNFLRGGGGKDTLTGGAGTDTFVLDNRKGADTITDFLSGTDTLRFNMRGLRVGDGDDLVENAVAASRGHFDANAELVIITTQIANGIGPIRAAAAIGSASTAYAAGQTCLFAVNNGTDTGVFLFTSAGADATVSASELTLVATLLGTPGTNLADYVFVP